jgi:hypothetical protein
LYGPQPKRRCWTVERTSGNVFSKHFSNERSPNRVLTYVKSALKIRSRNGCSLPGLVGRVEVWYLCAVWMRTPLVFNVDHPIGRVVFAKQADTDLVGRVEGWMLGAFWMRTFANHLVLGLF